MNLKIGKDISLIGFDENELAQFVRPQITVVRRQARETGEQAAEMLNHKIKGGQPEPSKPMKVILDVELMKYGSVKKLGE